MEEEHRSVRRAPGYCARAAVTGGSNNMYRGVTISVKALTRAILLVLAALGALAIVFLAGSGGFTVTFETDGGSQVARADLPLLASWSGVRRGPRERGICA